MGWAATYGSLDWTVVGPLYASGVAWTLVYDTLYVAVMALCLDFHALCSRITLTALLFSQICSPG